MDSAEPTSPTGGSLDSAGLADLPILVVDDDASILRALQRVLANRGWSVLSADRGESALAVLAKHEVAVVVSDFRMPKMDGVELLGRVRQVQPHADRILLTAFADLEAIERGVNDAGIHCILHKPCPIPALLDVVEESLRRSKLRRENELLLARLKNRNEELTYTNRLLADRNIASDQSIKLFRRRWDTALDAISDPLIIVNGALAIEGANAAALTLAGAPLQKLEGRPCYHALFGRPSACSGCPIATGEGRIETESPKRRRFYDARAYVLPGDSPAHLCVYRDVTEQVAFAREATQLEKLAAIGRLAGGVAHEINNPLQAILSFVQLAQKPDADAQKLPRYYEAIHESAVRCRDIVQALRSFSHQSSIGEKTRVDMRSIADKVLVLFRATSKVRLEIDQARLPACHCQGNANQLQQVLVNLVQNAIDASPQNGRVVLSVFRNDETAVLAVEDQGPGVPQAVLDKLFEPFFTTKPEGVGTGLGLAISQRIVHEHGGNIVVGQAEIGGARFEVHLPSLPMSEERKA